MDKSWRIVINGVPQPKISLQLGVQDNNSKNSRFGCNEQPSDVSQSYRVYT